MRLNAAIALQGLSTKETEAEEVIERIRYLLLDIEPNADVGVELLSVGTDFGAPIEFKSPLPDLLVAANALRYQLLSLYWRRREFSILRQSLRLAHTITSMNPAYIRYAMAEASILLSDDA